MNARMVTREEFDLAVEAIWTEVEYQNNMRRRTARDEAQDTPGFLTLGRVYLAEAEHQWAKQEARIEQNSLPYTEANETMRKLAGIFIRGMVYCGIYERKTS